MKKLLRVFALLLTVVFLGSMLFACSTPQAPAPAPAQAEEATSAPAAPEAQEPVEKAKLLVWEHTPQFEEPLKQVIAAFMSKNPNITVDYEIKTPDQYYNLLATTIQAGEAPDLFWTNGTATSNYGGYANQGVLMDITDKVDLSFYPAAALKLVDIDGRYYSTPGATADTRAVYYNKDIFTELGLSVPKTFDEFEHSLQTILDAGYVPLALGGSFFWSTLFTFEPILAAMAPDWLEAAAKNEVSVNDPRVADVFKKMIEWGEKGYFGPGYLGVDEGGQLLAFSKGEAAMTITGSWNVSTFASNNPDLKYGAFQLPRSDGLRPMIVTYACGFAVSANTEYPEAAIAFAQFASSIEGQSIWVKALNGIPGLPGIVSDDPVIAEMTQNDVQVESFYSILGDFAAEGANPRQILEEDATKVLSGSLTPEEFLQSIEALMK
ncbi:MAG: extracellular solute-binding protein [Eubacteriales bacterium]|nr:extracellular solute-binding protein [Eubacteriales bacterium]